MIEAAQFCRLRSGSYERTCPLTPAHTHPPQEVDERLALASDTRKKILAACEEYRPVAHRAMNLYFLIVDFSSVNPMYQVGGQADCLVWEWEC